MLSSVTRTGPLRAFSTSSLALSASKLVTPSLVHFKVGQIQEIVKHPEADKLYVSKIRHSTDDTTEPYTVCSGLVDYVSKESLLHSRVVLITNLKPSKMRGIRSEAMILAAEKTVEGATRVEVVSPPKESQIGDDLFFKPHIYDREPSRLKPKVWEEIQKGLFTDSQGRVVYRSGETGGVPLALTTETGEEAAFVGDLFDATVR